MTIEEKLKDYILKKYKSIREFTIAIDLPYSTLATIFKRGIANANVNNIIKICQALNISADELAAGKIVPLPINEQHNEIAIEDVIEQAKSLIINGDFVTINHKKVDEDRMKRILTYLDLMLEMEKRNEKDG